MLSVSQSVLITTLALTSILSVITNAEAVSKDSVIILIGDACISLDTYKAMIPSAYVGCVGDYFHWTIARADFQHIEQYYHVVYVTQDQQHHELGQAWFRDGDNYAYATNSYPIVAHELLHLQESAHFTSDKKHDFEKDLYPSLWAEERGSM